MPKLIILGSSNALSDNNHENTHMVLLGKSNAVLIDCVNNPIMRLEKAGLDFRSLTDLVLTHFHPDHVAGVPQLLMNMWLLGRRSPLKIHGLGYTLTRVKKMMTLYSWTEWPGFFPVTFHRVADKELAPVLAGEDFTISASPVQHFIPTIGLRMEFPASGKSFAYSCDTEPCDQVVRLAAGADIFLHEASGPAPGHSSPAEAGMAATRAEVGSLYLIHYPTGKFARKDLIAEARKKYQGPIELATDYMSLDL